METPDNPYTIDDLIYLMQRLRDRESGCPWDIKQTFATIMPHMIEETYEVADAIERNDWLHLKEELGDLLFQVIFYSQMAKEENLFEWSGVVDEIVGKLLRRHPHVFPDGTLQSRRESGADPDENEIKANWERIKAEEKAGKIRPEGDSLLGDIPRTLPGIIRAFKIQKKASSVGFDWPEIKPVINKVREELIELEEELAGNADYDRLEDEMADILFSCVNLSRFLKVDPETALRRANQKFERRFGQVEARIKQQGQEFHEASLQEMDQYWEDAKLNEK